MSPSASWAITVHPTPVGFGAHSRAYGSLHAVGSASTAQPSTGIRFTPRREAVGSAFTTQPITGLGSPNPVHPTLGIARVRPAGRFTPSQHSRPFRRQRRWFTPHNVGDLCGQESAAPRLTEPGIGLSSRSVHPPPHTPEGSCAGRTPAGAWSLRFTPHASALGSCPPRRARRRFTPPHLGKALGKARLGSPLLRTWEQQPLVNEGARFTPPHVGRTAVARGERAKPVGHVRLTPPRRYAAERLTPPHVGRSRCSAARGARAPAHPSARNGRSGLGAVHPSPGLVLDSEPRAAMVHPTVHLHAHILGRTARGAGRR